MIVYIQSLLDEFIKLVEHPFDKPHLASRVAVIAEEIDRLDPRDFVPAAQFSFVDLRRQLRNWSSLPPDFWIHLKHFQSDSKPISGGHESFNAGVVMLDDPSKALTWFRSPHNSTQIAFQELRKEIIKTLRETRVILGSYGGKDCRLANRQFPFIVNAALRKIVERDYRELSMILFPGAAWKSTVIVAGSILEAILYDQLTKDPATIARATTAANAPKKKGGIVRDILSDKSEDDWKLKDLIKVSIDLGIVTAERGNTIDQVLRDFRNFVHCRVELSSGHDITEAEATLAKGALEGVCNQLK